ncbi:MAG: MBL fold metallo-hydrolase [Lachnospiraceae bacterium]|jgi:flavorubredoxin|nr:MBL fold metallo-hydrolase [Lachnospiraceae bacterium]NBJ83093.1 MBL fold metallo-hydrolase [bacterium 1XD42-76]NBK06384.1 MBL fold metallo-hydrolase [bacterium 1XD42-94]
MNCVRKLTDSLYWVGVNDRRIALFENVYPVPDGVSYNSYLMLDEKCALFDTVDAAFTHQLFENIEGLLKGRSLDYLIVNHMEPDHCASIEDIVNRYPNVRIVCTAKAAAMMKQFFDFDVDAHTLPVKEGDSLILGRHELNFVMAPMVHWPEAMVSYERTEKILFSADAFGSFGAINGNIFADEIDYKGAWLPEARRYYTNIVGKFGMQVQALLKKAATLDISLICPLHSLVWRNDIPWLLEKYSLWSSYEPEEPSVVIAYASVYGHTQTAADLLAARLADRGITRISVYDVSKTHPSYIIADAFRASALVLASITYNNGIFCNMDSLLHQLVAHNLQKRTIALMENGTWAPVSAKHMGEVLTGLKNNTVLDAGLSIKSALKPGQEADLDALADALAAAVRQ